MSGQSEEGQEALVVPTVEELRERINAALGEMGAKDREIDALRIAHDKVIFTLTEERDKLIKPHQDERDRQMDRVVDDFTALQERGALKGKTLTVPNGKVAIRDGAEAMVVSDRKGAIAWLRRNRRLRQVTKIKVTRELVKDQVRALPTGVLEKLRPYLHFETKTRITATPNASQVEVTRDVNPHMREVGTSESK